MRSSKNRSRSKNRNRPSGGNVVNRVFDSSGPEGKVRGTPQQIIEKYGQLARDAQLAGDRVAVENFQQHAEHYTRMLAEAQREIDTKREQQEREQQARQDRERAEREARDARRAEHGDRDGGRDHEGRRGGRDGDGPGDERGPAEERAQGGRRGREDDRSDGDVMDVRGDEGPVEVPEAAGEAEAPPEPKRPRTRRARKPRNDPREDAAGGTEAAE